MMGGVGATLTYLLISILFYHAQACNSSYTVQLNASSFTIEEGNSLNVTCVYNVSQNLVTGFEWTQGDKASVKTNSSVFTVATKKTVKLTCCVVCISGKLCASQIITVNDPTVLILVICGVSALVVIILLAIIMKILMKRNEVQREARKRQRQRNMENISSPGTTVTGYW
ncbi:uncharacterized protein [Hoplias malabaricus]|uniref:uncharacterized protein n=1 Tax=Hoplias malabaricus TaxID=27720 RepID=UPI003461AD31